MDYFSKYIKYKKKYLDAKKINLNKQKGGNIDNLWIKDNFFEEKDFYNIKEYCQELNLNKDIRSPNRLSLCLNPKRHKILYDLIYKNKDFVDFINKIKDKDTKIKIKPSYPIEYRKYFQGSQGMEWHRDTSLFEPDCFEVVLTLTNSSNSEFQWQEDGIIKSISPKPNTLAIVRPKSVLHKVTPVNNGERTILKFIIEFIYNDKDDNLKKSNYFTEIEKCPF